MGRWERWSRVDSGIAFFFFFLFVAFFELGDVDGCMAEVKCGGMGQCVYGL